MNSRLLPASGDEAQAQGRSRRGRRKPAFSNACRNDFHGREAIRVESVALLGTPSSVQA